MEALPIAVRRRQCPRRFPPAQWDLHLNQLCLSPQCGFASNEEGNTLAEEQQWAKLRMIAEIAREVWG